MVSFVRTIKQVNAQITKVLLIIVSGLLAATMALLFFQVIGRYFLHFSPVWVVESAQFSFMWLALLGIPTALRKKEHISLEFLLNRAGSSIRKTIEILIHLLVMAVGATIAYSGIHLIFSLYDTFSPGMGISMGWVYSSTALCGSLLCLFELEFFFERLNRYRVAGTVSQGVNT